jgi:hypothetical protein
LDVIIGASDDSDLDAVIALNFGNLLGRDILVVGIAHLVLGRQIDPLRCIGRQHFSCENWISVRKTKKLKS